MKMVVSSRMTEDFYAHKKCS